MSASEERRPTNPQQTLTEPPAPESRVRKLVVEVIDPAMAEILRQKSGAERLRIAWGMWRSARDMLYNLLRAQQREWSEQQVQQEVARRLAHGTR
jgi:hypothetical protein